MTTCLVTFMAFILTEIKFAPIKISLHLHMDLKDVPVANEPQGNHVNHTDIPGVPEDDEDVKRMLRKLGEPVTSYGEGPGRRRERLKNVLEMRSKTEPDDMSEEEDDDNEVFYTPGPERLLLSRKNILHDSLKRASKRIQAQSEATKDPIKLLKHRRNINARLKTFELLGSQVVPGITRTLSSVRTSPYGGVLACGSWDGTVCILSQDDLKTKVQKIGHLEKVGSIDWGPENTLVSGGQEGSINQWKLDLSDEAAPVMEAATIERAHGERITSTLYHPTFDYIASTSFDQTWKLWDANTQEELLVQEGHSKLVLCGAFQPDGSIFCSGGQDAMARLWDMRSGRCISTLQGHAQAIHSVDFSPNGYHMATASADCLVKVWDLRKITPSNSSEIFTIPAHTKLVSCVRFFHGTSFPGALAQEVTDENDGASEMLDSSGSYLVTSSYDGLVNVWLADNWIKVCSLRGHTDKIMSCDVNGDGSSIYSCGWDKNIRVWGSISID